MTRTLFYTSQAGANAAAASIMTRISEFAADAGYSVDGSGYVTGVKLNGGAASGTQKLTSWDAAIGSASSWTIRHPEVHPLRRLYSATYDKSFLSYVMQDLGAPTITGTTDVDQPTVPAVAGWTKYAGNPLLGDASNTFFDPWVIKDGSTYKMWVSYRTTNKIAYSTSTNGVAWSTPVNCLSQISASESNVKSPCVLKIGSTYHMWYVAQALGNATQWVNYATSSDGITWTRITDRCVDIVGATWESAAVGPPCVLWNGSTYKMWYAGGTSTFEPDAIGYATSTDGSVWTKNGSNPIFNINSSCLWESQRVAVGSVVLVGGYYYLFYIGYRSNLGTINIARSVDGISAWERHPDNPIVRIDTNGGWDGTSIYKPCAFQDGLDWKLYYNGRVSTPEAIGMVTKTGSSLQF